VVLVEQEFVERRYDDDDPLAAAVSYVSVAEADQMYGIARDHGIRALAIESDEIRAFDERYLSLRRALGDARADDYWVSGLAWLTRARSGDGPEGVVDRGAEVPVGSREERRRSEHALSPC